METKAEIRKRILQARANLTIDEREEKNQIIQTKVMDLPLFKQADTVFLYMDCRAEVETSLLLSNCFLEGKQVGIPKILGDDMLFYEMRHLEDVERGYYNILEPVSGKRLEPEHALVIVPGVAFDENRVRMGYGRGFYDRYLKAHSNYRTVAIAYDCQIVQSLPAEGHDICPNMILTETRQILDREEV